MVSVTTIPRDTGRKCARHGESVVVCIPEEGVVYGCGCEDGPTVCVNVYGLRTGGGQFGVVGPWDGEHTVRYAWEGYEVRP